MQILNSRAVNFTLRRNMFSLSLCVSLTDTKALKKNKKTFEDCFIDLLKWREKKCLKKQKKRRERNKIKHAWEVVVSNIKPRVVTLWMTTESSVCISVPFTECSAHLSLYNEVVVWWITAQNKRKNRFAMKSRIFPLQFYSSNPQRMLLMGYGGISWSCRRVLFRICIKRN